MARLTKLKQAMQKLNLRPLQMLSLASAIEGEPSLVKAIIPEYDVTEWFWQEIDERTKGKQENHIVLFIYGATGTMKSSVAQTIAKRIQPDFKAEQIVFTDHAIAEIMPTIQQKQVIIRDESPKSHGEGSQQITHQIFEYAEMLRQDQKSLIFLRPVDMDFGQAHFKLRTIERTEDYSRVRVAIKNSDDNKFIGHAFIDIEVNNPVWNAYQERKRDFLKQVSEGNIEQFNIAKMAEEITKMPEYDPHMKIKDKKYLVYKKYPRLTTEIKKFIMSEIQMKERE